MCVSHLSKLICRLNISIQDLLTSLRHHAARFYTSHNLLFSPTKQVRTEPWASKKRRLLEAEGVLTEIDKGSSRVGSKVGPKGKYRKRDMYGAVEGQGLLALGRLPSAFLRSGCAVGMFVFGK